MRLLLIAVGVYAVYVRVFNQEYYLGVYGLRDLQQIKHAANELDESGSWDA